MLYRSQENLETGTYDLHHPVPADARNTDSWHTRKGDLQRAFLLGVPMVPSSVLTIATDGERLPCGSFSINETIHFRIIEFIADHFVV
jgi:hypothetical protein